MPDHDRIGIILDNDVFTVDPFEFQQEVLERRLAEMRWLKNKAFFGIISKKALATFQ